MRNLHAACIASLIAFAPAASAVDMAPEERSELRERADRMNSERQRNPSWDGGERRLNEPRGEVQLNRNRGEVRTKTASAVPKARGERVKGKVKRTVKELPGSLVRKRQR